MLHSNRERIAAQEISDAFTTSGTFYDPNQIILVNEMARYLSNVVQNEQCIARQSQANPGDVPNSGGILKNIMCDFSYAYTPLPVKQMIEKSQLIKNGTRIGSGSLYGRIYSNVFSGNEIVTKSPINWSTTSIIEHFISFRVINSLLTNNLLANHLVASYGIFVCPSNIPNSDKTNMAPSKVLEICYSPKAKGLSNKNPTMFIVQRKVNGNTLSDYFNKNQVSLADLLVYIRQIAITLIGRISVSNFS